VIKDYFAKLILSYEPTDMGKSAAGDKITGKAHRFGFQIQQ